jgi:SGNH hydrolase-like domain, acetyltransferase AlgX
MTHSPSIPRPARRRKWLGPAAAILFGVAAAWLLIEVLVRVAGVGGILPINLQSALRDVRVTPWSSATIVPPALMEPDDVFGTIVRPGFVDELQVASTGVTFHATTANPGSPESALGFRVPSPGWQATPPVDAIALGDSFTFCWTEYQDCWVTRLTADYGLQVANLGVPNTGSVSHLRVLTTNGLAYHPRVVIWQWYGNDAADDWAMQKGGALDQGLDVAPDTALEATSPPPGAAASTRSQLRNYSALAAIIDRLARPPDVGITPRYHYNSAGLSLSFWYDVFPITFDMSQARNQTGWELSQEAILRAQSLAASAQSRLLIVIIPTKEIVYRDITSRFVSADQLAMLDTSRQAMLAFCADKKLWCLDATPNLTQHAQQGEQVYWPEDLHLNPAGNHILADAVADALRQEGIAK